MEFDEALRAAQHLIDLAPTHPAGYFYRAATYWQWRLITPDPHQRASLLTQFQQATQHARELVVRHGRVDAAQAAGPQQRRSSPMLSTCGENKLLTTR